MKRQIIFAGIILCFLSPALLQGQETGLLRMDKKHQTSKSDVSLWGGVEEGRFKPAHAALFQWSAGAEGRFFRPGKTTTWVGTVSLEQTMGKHLGSSLFLEPEHFPMDLWETTTGMASRQTGHVEMAFLGDLSDLWAAGLRASLKAANEAKRKELPHSSFGMDLQLEPTLTFLSDDDACIIASYLVQLRTERVKMEQDVFFDRGMGYWSYEPGNTIFPVLEFTHGFNGSYHSPEFSLGFGINWKRGQAGGEDYSRFRFPGSTIKGSFETMVEGFDVDQVYRVSYQRERDQLREAVDDGYSSLSDRTGRNVSLRFGLQPHDGALKIIAIDLDANQWLERTTVSPYDSIKQYGGTATLLSSLSFGKFDLDANVSAGRGWWQDRGRTYETEDDPLRLTENWLRKMDYRMVPRMGMGGALTWHATFLKGLSFRLYACWYRAFKDSHLGGKNREIATLTIGYTY